MALLSIARWAHSLIPSRHRLPARLLYFRARSFFYRGDTVHCPCCGGRSSRFVRVGSPLRAAACPRCDSRERHRLLHLYLAERTNLFRDRLRVLHVAPEDCLQPILRRLPNLDYLSADLSSGSAMVSMDIMDIQLADASFDVVLCSHVLEHVPDDRRAMRELYRVLKPGGWAILQVPLDPMRAETFEDPSVVTPRERDRLFGQWDHVRVYGRPDYEARLHQAGFTVQAVRFAAELPPEVIGSYGLDVQEEIFFCRRPLP